MSTITMTARRGPGRRQLALLVLVAGLPFVVSWVLYFNPQWLPQPVAQHGELLAERPQLADFALHDFNGAPLELPQQTGLWLMVTVVPGICDANCQNRVVEQRQVRRALAVERSRLLRILALPASPQPESEGQLRRHSPDLTIALGGTSQQPGTYLIDPHGEAVLHYAEDAPAKGTLKDIKRVMKISRSW